MNLDQAIEACPGYAPAYYNVAVVHSETGRASLAVTQYQAALAASPTYAEAWCNLGVIHKNEVIIVSQKSGACKYHESPT